MTIFHNNTQTKPQPVANDSYKGTVMKFIAVSSLFIPITAFSLRILMSIRPIADRDMVDVAEEKLWSVRAATDEAEHQPKSLPSMDVEIDDIISVVDVYW